MSTLHIKVNLRNVENGERIVLRADITMLAPQAANEADGVALLEIRHQRYLISQVEYQRLAKELL